MTMAPRTVSMSLLLQAYSSDARVHATCTGRFSRRICHSSHVQHSANMLRLGATFPMPKKLVLVALLFCFLASIKAQTPAPAPPSPKTPAEYFRVAKQQSDIHQEGAKPFEMIASFTATDQKGHARTGTYSETWISKDRWKREVIIGNYREATSTFSGDYYRFISADQMDSAAGDVLENITPSAPVVESADEINKEWVAKPVKYGGVNLIQISQMMHFEDRGDLSVSGYYFSPESGYIRSAQSLIHTTFYNDLRAVLGRIVPFSINVKTEGKESTVIKIDSFKDPGNPPDEAFLIPGASKAKSLTGPADRMASGVIQGLILRKEQPIFPITARTARQGGDIELSVTIGRDGRIRHISIVKANRADLAASAISAVRDYVYKPFTLNGVPVDVTGTITVHYVVRP